MAIAGAKPMTLLLPMKVTMKRMDHNPIAPLIGKSGRFQYAPREKSTAGNVAKIILMSFHKFQLLAYSASIKTRSR